jgi:hypothetical protein
MPSPRTFPALLSARTSRNLRSGRPACSNCIQTLLKPAAARVLHDPDWGRAVAGGAWMRYVEADIEIRRKAVAKLLDRYGVAVRPT